MTADVTLYAAFGAGLVSFLSPCVLPIIAGYLSLVTGLEVAELEHDARAHFGSIAAHTGLYREARFHPDLSRYDSGTSSEGQLRSEISRLFGFV